MKQSLFIFLAAIGFALGPIEALAQDPVADFVKAARAPNPVFEESVLAGLERLDRTAFWLNAHAADANDLMKVYFLNRRPGHAEAVLRLRLLAIRVQVSGDPTDILLNAILYEARSSLVILPNSLAPIEKILARNDVFLTPHEVYSHTLDAIRLTYEQSSSPTRSWNMLVQLTMGQHLVAISQVFPLNDFALRNQFTALLHDHLRSLEALKVEKPESRGAQSLSKKIKALRKGAARLGIECPSEAVAPQALVAPALPAPRQESKPRQARASRPTAQAPVSVEDTLASYQGDPGRQMELAVALFTDPTVPSDLRLKAEEALRQELLAAATGPRRQLLKFCDKYLTN